MTQEARCCEVALFHRVIETRTANNIVRRRWQCIKHGRRWTECTPLRKAVSLQTGEPLRRRR